MAAPNQLNASPKTKNPFKRLFWTADLCAFARVALAFSAMLYFGNLYHALVVFIVCSLVTDTLVLKPTLKRVFATQNFSEEHVAWLKEKQDISPDELKVFFKKVVSYRTLACSLAFMSIPAIWLLTDETLALKAAPFVYVVVFFFMCVMIRQLVTVPKSYRGSSRSKDYNRPYMNDDFYRSDPIREWDQTGALYRTHRLKYGPTSS